METILWRILAWWLLRSLPPAAAAPVIGDLLEEHAAKRARSGPVRAMLWLAGESLSVAIVYRPQLRATAKPRRSAMDMLRSDLLNVVRIISIRPTATVATAVVIGLGIGLVSAMFALADPFLFRPLPYLRPGELVNIRISVNPGVKPGIIPTLADWQARRDLFTDVAAYTVNQPTRLTVPGRQHRVADGFGLQQFLSDVGTYIDGSVRVGSFDRSLRHSAGRDLSGTPQDSRR